MIQIPTLQLVREVQEFLFEMTDYLHVDVQLQHKGSEDNEGLQIKRSEDFFHDRTGRLVVEGQSNPSFVPNEMNTNIL